MFVTIYIVLSSRCVLEECVVAILYGETDRRGNIYSSFFRIMLPLLSVICRYMVVAERCFMHAVCCGETPPPPPRVRRRGS
jgi:hypothetical protein